MVIKYILTFSRVLIENVSSDNSCVSYRVYDNKRYLYKTFDNPKHHVTPVRRRRLSSNEYSYTNKDTYYWHMECIRVDYDCNA